MTALPNIDALSKLLAEATPGPWRVEAGTTLVWGCCDPDDHSDRGMGYPISDSRTRPMSTWAKGPSGDEGIANAALIALAPALAARVIELEAMLIGGAA